MDLLTKKDITIDDIQALIDNGIEESLNLEYKAAGALGKGDREKMEITKDVAAFANSNGGILIYGVKEKDNKPTELSFIDGNLFNREWLEHIITLVHKPIKLEIIPVRDKGDISKTVYVIRIPESTDAPHMAHDGKYYRRMNFKVVHMEEYEVRNLYNRKDKGKLILLNPKGKYMGFESVMEPHMKTFFLELTVENVSNTVERQYKVITTFKRCPSLSCLKDVLVMRSTGFDGEVSFSSTAQVPIFPKEVLSIMNLKMSVHEDNLKACLDSGDISIIVHYSSGTSLSTVSFGMLYKEALLKKKVVDENNQFIRRFPR